MAECVGPGGDGLGMKKYQSFVAYQADKVRRRTTYLVGASYDEEKKYTVEYDLRGTDGIEDHDLEILN